MRGWERERGEESLDSRRERNKKQSLDSRRESITRLVPLDSRRERNKGGTIELPSKNWIVIG